jgi:hypothetical protein
VLLAAAEYGYWGFSPANVPEGGYDAWGVDALGMDPNGYPSNKDRTLVNRGFAGCPGREPVPDPPRSAYTNGVVTPHAAFLALRYRPRETMANLAALEEKIPGMFGQWGFADSVNVDTKHVSGNYLSLDQGMIMAALGNELGDDVLREAFSTPDTRRALRPVIGVEEFNVSPRACTITGTRGDDRSRARRATTSSAACAAKTGSTVAAAPTRSSATSGRTASRAAPATTPPTAERAKTSFAAGTARTCCRPARATMSSPGARAPTTPRAARGATPASPTQRTTRLAAADGCAARPSAAHLTQCVAVDALPQRAPEVGSVFLSRRLTPRTSEVGSPLACRRPS